MSRRDEILDTVKIKAVEINDPFRASELAFDAALEEVRKWAEETDYCRPLDDFNRYALDEFLDELQWVKGEK